MCYSFKKVEQEGTSPFFCSGTLPSPILCGRRHYTPASARAFLRVAPDGGGESRARTQLTTQRSPARLSLSMHDPRHRGTERASLALRGLCIRMQGTAEARPTQPTHHRPRDRLAPYSLRLCLPRRALMPCSSRHRRQLESLAGCAAPEAAPPRKRHLAAAAARAAQYRRPTTTARSISRSTSRK